MQAPSLNYKPPVMPRLETPKYIPPPSLAAGVATLNAATGAPTQTAYDPLSSIAASARVR
jgi:hypothetical protein